MFRKSRRYLKRKIKPIALYVVLIIVCCTLYNIAEIRNWYQKENEFAHKKKHTKTIKIAEQLVQLRKNDPEHVEEFTKEDMLDENGNPYRIIIWVNAGGVPSYKANPQECMGNINCEITFDKQYEETAHALVFRFDEMYRHILPKTRKPFQLYAWWISESPLHSFISYDEPHFFNLTFHYRTDADVYAPYGSINLILRELKAEGKTDVEALLAKKRKSNKMAAWAVSNCYNRRLDYGNKLMASGLQVDTYGLCFGYKELGKGRYSDSFYEQLSEYKFYLAFENSIDCKDYITEKFWYNSLKSGAVPIVWGPRKEDVLKVAPAKSFIHTSDFASTKELVKYLNYLANNETAYAEYLEWRTWIDHPERMEERLRIKSMDDDLRSFCKLCAIVQEHGKRRKLKLPVRTQSVSTLSEAWLGPEKGRCRK